MIVRGSRVDNELLPDDVRGGRKKPLPQTFTYDDAARVLIVILKRAAQQRLSA